ncbi:hypothetical protein V8G54_009839 [Vigna mungo]|uniref:Integrase catalytic domain-containing protein n=1 Tax=Vigna mungo TaxID=3915 RepID=A0AAQ3NXH2_VIGMU
MSCPYTSQQNDRAERKHRHITEFCLTLLAQAKMPLHYWWEAFSTTVYLINRLPSLVTQNESPYSLLFRKEPDYNSLKPFGCACYPCLKPYKPDYNSLKPFGCACYPCLKPYNQHKLQFHTTRCVFLGYNNSHKGYKCINSHGRIFSSRHVVFNEEHFPFHDGFLNTRSSLKTLTESPSASFYLPIAGNSHIGEATPSDDNNPDVKQEPTSPTGSAAVNLSRDQDRNDSTRNSSISHDTDPTETVAEAPQDLAEPSTTINTHWTRSKAGIHKPKQPYVGLAETCTDEKEPENVTKHSQDHNGKKLWIMSQENIIDSKWVFKTKYKADGKIERRKARLVAKGFQQTTGLNYEETFSPVVKASTIRIILSIAVHLNWEGFVDSTKPEHVCKLSKAIYGLKQAPRAWFDSLKNALLSWGFKNTKSDSSLFTLRGTYHITFLLIYVDDIIVAGNNTKFLESFIKQLNVVFSLKDLGPLHYFLGIEVQRDASGMYLKQSKYIGDILRKFKMENASSCPTPMVTDKQFTTEGEKLKDPTQGTKRILRYLQGTIQHCLHIKPSTDLDLTGFSYAYWATSVDDRKSMAGQCVFLGETLVSWSSRKQKVVSRSSAESKYRALDDLAAEIAWTCSLLDELRLSLPRKPTLWCDNLSAKALASNPVMHARSKHIEIDVHYIRDQVLQNEIIVAYVPSADQIANCLTKALTHTRFNQLKDKLGVTLSPISLKGGIRDKIL